MSLRETELKMTALQKQMEDLQIKEAKAHERKIQAESEIAACNVTWYQVYNEYQELRNKLNKETYNK